MSKPPPAWFLLDVETGTSVRQHQTLPFGGKQNDGAEPTHDVAVKGRPRQERKRQTVDRIRVRVNAQGAAYVEGLQDGRVYDAHIKPQWPDTIWLEATGLSHSCFLFTGMYEVVDPGDPAKS